MKDTIIVTGILVVGTLAFIALISIPAIFMAQYRCSKLETISGKKTEYVLFNGCYVEVNGRLIPQENWRGEYDN